VLTYTYQNQWLLVNKVCFWSGDAVDESCCPIQDFIVSIHVILYIAALIVHSSSQGSIAWTKIEMHLHELTIEITQSEAWYEVNDFKKLLEGLSVEIVFNMYISPREAMFGLVFFRFNFVLFAFTNWVELLKIAPNIKNKIKFASCLIFLFQSVVRLILMHWV